MIRPKLIALALAGIMTLAGLAGCTGGEDGNTPSLVPTHSPVGTEAPDPRSTMLPASTAKAQIALDPTSTPSGIVSINKDALKTVVALVTSTLAPTPTPTPTPTWPSRPIKPTRIVIPTIPAIPTITFTFATPIPRPTWVPLPTAVIAITPIPVPTRIPVVPPTRISLLPTPSPSPTPTAQALTVAEYLAWCAINTSNDTTARVLGIDPSDFADASTVTNGDMVRALEAHVEVVDSVVPPSAIDRFHTAQRNWFEGLSGFYGRYPANEYVDWGSFEQNLLADTDLSWRLLTFTTVLERLPDHIRNPITNNCFN